MIDWSGDNIRHFFDIVLKGPVSVVLTSSYTCPDALTDCRTSINPDKDAIFSSAWMCLFFGGMKVDKFVFVIPRLNDVNVN